jgi:hypothetical protein
VRMPTTFLDWLEALGVFLDIKCQNKFPQGELILAQHGRVAVCACQV